MLPRYRNTICVLGKYMQNNLPLMSAYINYPIPNDTSQQVRSIKKHYNQKFRKERGQKVMKVPMPKFNESEEAQQDLFRSRLKKCGILPQRTWHERPVIVNSTPKIFETYVIPEGDGKFSSITTVGAKQKVEYIEKKSKSMLAIKKIKTYDENFAPKLFGDEALDIYKNAHKALVNKDEASLLQYVTETAYPIITHNMMDKTIVWKFLESLEPARVVHARCTSLITKGNMFAQVTIRFHTQQILCIYDRFGRRLLGSETVKKDVLDYVVFEKHLSNVYGLWRIHGKIVPNWMAPAELPGNTYVLPQKEEKALPSKDAIESVAHTVPPETLDRASS